MARKEKKEDLLAELAESLDIICLSDLSLNVTDRELARAVIPIPESKYELDEWLEAVQYITRFRKVKIDRFKSVEEAKLYLIDFPF